MEAGGEGMQSQPAAGGRMLTLPAGSLSGTYSAVLLMTDLESDDAVAIKILAPMLMGVPMLVVVGEGDADKREMAAAVLSNYGLREHVSVVQGLKSRVRYPKSALTAYTLSHSTSHSHAHGSEGPTVERDVSAGSCIRAFLQKHPDALALILKPPRELLSDKASPPLPLSRASAALYGSFNLVAMRAEIKAKDPALTEADLLARQESLLRSFRRCVLVERSDSVGRDAVLDPTGFYRELWPYLADDVPLMRLVEAWNGHSVRSQSEALGALAAQIATASETDARAAFELVKAKVGAMEKKLAILSSIAHSAGQQICLADPVVCALVIDSEDALTPYCTQAPVQPASEGEGVSAGELIRFAAVPEQRQQVSALVLRILLDSFKSTQPASAPSNSKS